MNQFPSDFPHTLTGFGGDPSLDRAQHRERSKKCPVILVHGNASKSVHPKFGMETMKAFLKGEEYQDCEIWAMDYLGENNGSHELFSVHRNRIDAFVSWGWDYFGKSRGPQVLDRSDAARIDWEEDTAPEPATATR